MVNRDWEEKAETEGTYAIACALMAVAGAIQRLGNADAASPMGGLEALGGHLGEKIERLAESFEYIAGALRDAGEEIGNAIVCEKDVA